MELPDDILGRIVHLAPLEFLSVSRAWSKMAMSVVESARTKEASNWYTHVIVYYMQFIRAGIRYTIYFPNSYITFKHNCYEKYWKIVRRQTQTSAELYRLKVYYDACVPLDTSTRDMRILSKAVELCGPSTVCSCLAQV